MLKINILLITTLYPKNPKQSNKEISYAVHYFLKEWKLLGHRVEVIALDIKHHILDKKVLKKFELDQVPVTSITVNKIPKLDFNPRSYCTVANLIKNNLTFKPDIIVSHMINPSFYIAKQVKENLKGNVPLFLTLHQTDIIYLTDNKKRFKFKESIKAIDGLGFRSENLREKYLKLNVNDNLQKHIIYSGIEEKFILSEDEIRSKAESKVTGIIVAATLTPLKKIDVLIKAFSQMKNNGDLKLTIVGDGDDKNRLETLCAKEGIEDKVLFVGRLKREETIKLMRDNQVFALVSSPETFGLVYMESMASGCITIGTRGEGIDGVIIDGENGFLCEKDDVKNLANILDQCVLFSSHKKFKMLKIARDTTVKMNQKNQSKMYLEHLKELVINNRF